MDYKCGMLRLPTTFLVVHQMMVLSAIFSAELAWKEYIHKMVTDLRLESIVCIEI